MTDAMADRLAALLTSMHFEGWTRYIPTRQAWWSDAEYYAVVRQARLAITMRPTPAIRDAEAIEQIEDDRRILQALRNDLYRGALVASAATVARTERLIRVYADKLADLPAGNDTGCPCVRLPSGNVHPCRDHELPRSARLTDTFYQHTRPDASLAMIQLDPRVAGSAPEHVEPLDGDYR